MKTFLVCVTRSLWHVLNVSANMNILPEHKDRYKWPHHATCTPSLHQRNDYIRYTPENTGVIKSNMPDITQEDSCFCCTAPISTQRKFSERGQSGDAAAQLLTGAEEIPSVLCSQRQGTKVYCMPIQGSGDNRRRCVGHKSRFNARTYG